MLHVIACSMLKTCLRKLWRACKKYCGNFIATLNAIYLINKVLSVVIKKSFIKRLGFEFEEKQRLELCQDSYLLAWDMKKVSMEYRLYYKAYQSSIACVCTKLARCQLQQQCWMSCRSRVTFFLYTLYFNEPIYQEYSKWICACSSWVVFVASYKKKIRKSKGVI